ncbi:MAG TPA: SRPBCC family protein [Acidimicrobiales bacterium]|nr:SRPBCC family protein [Acidimicrobiales bacterium]
MEKEAAVAVQAPTDAIWAVVVDVERWPEVTPSMTEVRRLDDGELRPGSKARIRQPGFAPAQWEVTVVDPPRIFTWVSSAPGVRTVAEHEIRSTPGGSELVLRLRQSGPLAPVVRAVYGRRIRRFLEQEAAGLAGAAEARVRTLET